MNKSHEAGTLNGGISIILPALNEEQNLEALVSEIINYFNTKQTPYEIIVVNDGSTDKTGEIAENLSLNHNNVSVIHHPQNKGYGKSLKDGFQKSKYEYLFFTDADRQFSINNLDTFLPYLEEREVDMVIGYRIDRKDSHLRKFFAWCFNRTVRILFSLNYKDIDCAFKLFKKNAIEGLEVKSDGFLINAEILAKTELKGLKVVQIGVEHLPRLEGKSTVSYQSILSALKNILFLYQEVNRWKKRYKFKTSNIPDQYPKVLWAFFLLLLFFSSLFPLDWAASFSRSHDSVLTYSPFDFILVVIGITGIGLVLFFFFVKLPEVLVKTTNRITSLFYNCSESLFLTSCLIICFLLINLFSYFALEHIPHVQDSIAQLFQAKIFKMGSLSVPVPPHREFFDYMNIINQDRWYSQYPPGHSFLLMIGLFFKAPWIINPLLGTLSLILLYLLAKNCYGEKRVSYLSTVFFLLSPFFLFMSSSYMNHNSTMFFILLFIYFYTKTLQRPFWYYSLISGLALGYAMNIKPLTAFALGLPFCLDFTLHVYKKRGYYLNKLLWFGLGLSLMLTILFTYNYFTNGNPFLFGYQIKYHTLGFLGSAQMGPPHTLKGGFINTSNNLTALNKYLFEWPLPSLLFVFILFLPWIKKNRWDWLFLLSSLSLVVSYFFYYYQDLCFGPRFYYSSTPLLIVLTVRGFLKLPNILGKFSFNRYKVEATLYLLISLCFTYTLFSSLPVLFKKYSNFYWHVDNTLHKTVTQMNITNAIVFINIMHPPGTSIDGKVPPGTTVPNLPVYGAGFLYNSPDLDDEVIYALDLGIKNGELMREYPKRNYYLWKFDPEIDDFTLESLNP